MMINPGVRLLPLAALLLLFTAGCPQEGSDACSDQYEPNETCLQAFDLGTVGEGEAERSWQGTICTATDQDWYKIYAEEEEEGICFPFSDQTLTLRIGLVPPAADCRDLNLYLYDDGCVLLDSSQLPGCQEEEILFAWDGTCSLNDSRSFIIQVRGADDSHGIRGGVYPLPRHLGAMSREDRRGIERIIAGQHSPCRGASP